VRGGVGNMAARYIFLIVVLFNSSLTFAAFEENKILLIKSSDIAMYQNVELAFKQFLVTSESDLMNVRSLVVTEIDNSKQTILHLSAAYDLILTIGTEAAEKILSAGAKTPIVSVLLPQQTYLALINLERKNYQTEFDVFRTAIYLDQPFQRQIGLANLVDPQGDVSVFGESPYNNELNNTENCFSSSVNSKLNKVSIYQENIAVTSIPQVLDKTGIAVATPLFIKKMADNAKWLLYMAYQRNIPVIGYSEAFVRAGAVAAVFSTSEDFGKEAAEVVNQLFRSQRYPLVPPKHPQYFTVRVNQRVAKSLGFRNLSELQLIASLKKMEIACSDYIRQNNDKPKQRMTQLKHNE